MTRHQTQFLTKLRRNCFGPDFELAVLVGRTDVPHIRPLPYRRHAGIDRYRLVPGIEHRNAGTRGAHDGRQYEQRVAECADRCAVFVQIAGVVGIHEHVAAGLHFGVDAG